MEATALGDHTHDGELNDPTAQGHAAEVRDDLRALGEVALESVDEQVDAAILRTALRAELLELERIREASWNPMLHNPGEAIHALLFDFAPAEQRLESVIARLAAIPDYLDAARTVLRDMPPVHVATAIDQLGGTSTLITTLVADLAAAAGRSAPDVSDAVSAVDVHAAWLHGQLPGARRDPRLGEELFAAKLALTLDTDVVPADLLTHAEADLAELTERITEHAGRMAGIARPDATTVRAVLDDLAAEAPDDDTILAMCRASMAEATAFVRGADLLTVYDDAVDIVAMPEIDRGVAVAYCRSPGALETASLPTEFAVSPTPRDWGAERVASFYREYNAHMVADLTVHEAMPGHALQLMHANRADAATPIRAVFGSGSFIEGWAVYAEQLMADHGYRGDVSQQLADALRMQQLKMALRTTLNAILDIRFHCDGLDEATAMTMMTTQAFQEDGEAAGKWRRVQLSSTQLCTYYVGWREVRDLVADLRRAEPDRPLGRIHDTVLSCGSPPVRHLRTLLGVPS